MIAVVALLTLASCATPGPLLLPAPGSSARENGYVMFSMTGSGPADAVRRLCLSLRLRGISNAITRQVTSCMRERLLPGAGENDPMGKMVLIELPPGEYEFDDYEGAGASFSGVRYSAPPGFEYKFDVASATINYLGDLNFALARGIGYQQMGDLNLTPTQVLSLHFQVLDRQDRDAPLFDTQFPAYSRKEKTWCDGCALHNP